MSNNVSAFIPAIILCLAAIPTAQAMTYGSCEARGGISSFNTQFSADWTKEQNVAGTTYPIPASASGSGYNLDCTCAASDGVNIYFASTTPLPQGHHSGYFKLNDSLDINMQIADIPGGLTLAVPTVDSAAIKSDGYYRPKDNNSVCTAADESIKTNAPVFSVGSNTTLTLYVTKPFLGELDIPTTHIATVRAAWSNNMSRPQNGYNDIAQLYLQGKIIVPQECVINQGDVIHVDLGFISAEKFTRKNQPPEGYTPVEFNISYDCGDMSAIKNSLYIEVQGEDVVDQVSLVARRRATDNVPDVGIHMEDTTDGSNVMPFIGGVIDIPQSGSGSTQMLAYPVNLVGGQLQPGPFKGTATLTVKVR